MQMEEFARDFLEGVLADTAAAADGEGAFQESVFVGHVLELLTGAGAAVDPKQCQFRARHMKIDAYDYLDDSDELDLFVADYDNAFGIRKISVADVVNLLGRGVTFLRRSLEGLHERLEESKSFHAESAVLSDQALFVVVGVGGGCWRDTADVA